MNKSQQIRRSRRVADVPRQARCDVRNEIFGSNVRLEYQLANDPFSQMPIAACAQTLRQSRHATGSQLKNVGDRLPHAQSMFPKSGPARVLGPASVS
jgi:hypothetical protein